MKVTAYFNTYISVFFSLIVAPYSFAIENSLENVEVEKAKPEFIFDDALFRGSSANKDLLLKLSKGDDFPAGTYKVALYINNNFFEDTSIRFILTPENKTEACFDAKLLTRANILVKKQTEINSDSEHCEPLTHLVDHSSYTFDFSRLKLDLSIPNSFIKQTPRGYVSPAMLSEGSSIGFINYITNYYYSKYDVSGSKSSQDSTYVSLNGGVNFGQWQFRQQSSLINSDQGFKWNNIRSYINRPLIGINSELSLGQLYGTGRFFSGLSFNGLSLRTDDRMLPDSMRGYAPVIQGVAKTFARVSVLQDGREIYQTTVAAGPFKISDLYPTNFNGDLEVVVTEADGTSSSFYVPFSAVPESLRQGAFKYNLDIGRTRGIGEDTVFSNITTQYGLNNMITLNNGLRVADGYVAAMFGTAYTNYIGAFAVEATYSHAKLPEQDYVDGWMFGANYSKTFQRTSTTLALAGYRFSTSGYYDLPNVISLRKSMRDGVSFQSNTLNEESRATLILNQTLGNFGTLFISGSASSYRDDKPKDYQLQLGYGKAFKNGINMNVSISRQQQNYNGRPDIDSFYPNSSYSSNNNTNYALSFNFPLSNKYARSAQQNLAVF